MMYNKKIVIFIVIYLLWKNFVVFEKKKIILMVVKNKEIRYVD